MNNAILTRALVLTPSALSHRFPLSIKQAQGCNLVKNQDILCGTFEFDKLNFNRVRDRQDVRSTGRTVERYMADEHGGSLSTSNIPKTVPFFSYYRIDVLVSYYDNFG